MKIEFKRALINEPSGYQAGELDGLPFILFTHQGNSMFLQPESVEEGQALCALLGFMATSLFIRQPLPPPQAPTGNRRVPSNLVGIDGKPIG